MGAILSFDERIQVNSCFASRLHTILGFRPGVWLKVTRRSTQLEWLSMEHVSQINKLWEPTILWQASSFQVSMSRYSATT
jgi:hypothetical protein